MAVPGSGTSGLVSLVVAHDTGGGRVRVCGYLVDAYCLGVKNTIGPRVMDQQGLAEFARSFFGGVSSTAPGSAGGAGAAPRVRSRRARANSRFDPAPGSDFGKTKGHLGRWSGFRAISFGRQGKPFFVQGPRDHTARIMKTLERSVGPGNFDFLVVQQPYFVTVRPTVGPYAGSRRSCRPGSGRA